MIISKKMSANDGLNINDVEKENKHYKVKNGKLLCKELRIVLLLVVLAKAQLIFS